MSFSEYDPNLEPYSIGSRAILNGIQYLKTVHGDETPPETEGSKWVDEELMRNNPVDESDRRADYCKQCSDTLKSMLEGVGLSYEEVKNLISYAHEHDLNHPEE